VSDVEERLTDLELALVSMICTILANSPRLAEQVTATLAVEVPDLANADASQ
jgi:hypothetical protein